MNVGKIIFFGLALVLLTATRPVAAAVLVCDSPIDKLGLVHKLRILMPKNYTGSVGYRDEFGKFFKQFGDDLGNEI